MSGKRLQIALEFMIIFSFLLVLFLFLFALIASQRAQILSSQIFSQEQLVAQNVAMQLDRALQAGNGYYAAVPIIGTIGTLNYQLLMTKNGAVIVNASVGKQTMQAVTYSSVKTLVSNPSFLQASTPYYNLPILNGTLTLQNSYGTICVDYACPSSANVASNLSLTAQAVHAAKFNGQTTYVNLGSGTSLNWGTGNFAVSFWIGPRTEPNGWSWIMTKNSGQPGIAVTVMGGQLRVSVGNWFTDVVTDPGRWSITQNDWHFIVVTRQGGTIYSYVDGSPYGTSVASNYDFSGVSGSPMILGVLNPATSTWERLNGSIANFQTYNTSLSATDVNSIYYAGIGAAPIKQQGLVGWWPLNGNANDYSGKGNNGIVAGPLLFTATAQMSAKVVNQAGIPVANTLVGFTTTFGNFTSSSSYSNYTNANGIATAFLNQQGNNGQALVEAVALNGNTALSSDLVGWWPLGNGQGNIASDLSGNSNHGTMNGNVYWTTPNYVASFDGQGSFVDLGSSASLNPTSTITVAAWVKTSYLGQQRCIISKFIGTGCNSWYWTQQPDNTFRWRLDVAEVGGWQDVFSNSVASKDTWYYLVGTYDGTWLRLYVNGVEAGTALSAAGTIASCPSTSVHIGDCASGSVFNGSISNIQIYNTALAANQILNLYQQGISSIPLITNLVGWWPLNGDAIDYSKNGYNGTIYGNTNFASTSTIPATNSNATSMLSGIFNGASNSISIASTPALQSSGSVTVSGWIYFNTNGGWMMVDRGVAGAGAWYLYSDGLTWTEWSIFGPTGTRYDLQMVYPLEINRWYHLAATYNATAGTMSGYINGLAFSSRSSAVLGPSTANILIGRYAGGGYFVNGKISNIQIYNASLPAGVIKAIYQRGISGVPASSGLVGWWPLNGNANDYSRLGNNGTYSSMAFAPQSVVQPYLLAPLGNYGANFNGQSGYVNAVHTSSMDFVNAVTVSAWIKPNVVNTWNQASAVESFEGGGNYKWKLGLTNFGSVRFDVCGTVGCLSGNYMGLAGGNVLPNSWYQIAGVYNGSAVSVYLNGVQVATSGWTGAMPNPANPIKIGYEPANNRYFNGSIANVQVYKTGLDRSQIKSLYVSQMPASASVQVPMSWVP
jgi:hypothetical protein